MGQDANIREDLDRHGTSRNGSKDTLVETALQRERNQVQFRKLGVGKRVVTSDPFDYILGVVLLWNAMVMGTEVDWRIQARDFNEADPALGAWVDRWNDLCHAPARAELLWFGFHQRSHRDQARHKAELTLTRVALLDGMEQWESVLSNVTLRIVTKKNAGPYR